MRTILVNKSEDPIQLKILFPTLKLAVGGVPAYGRIIYSDFSFTGSSKMELLFQQSTAGYNLDSHLGILGFLNDCEYMPSSKLQRFEAAGRERVVDSSGREVTPEGVFHKSPDVLAMYFYCSMLRVSNRVFVDEPLEVSYVLDLLESPLYFRLLEADRMGHRRLLERVLQLMDSFYSQDIQFRAKGKGRVGGFDRMSQLMNSFDSQGFKSFSLSGEDEQDIYSFLSLFGES